jgi:hypothetical protein
MAEYRFVDRDNFRPTEIEHKCDEIFDGEALEQKYNYIVYHFDCKGTYFWARTYTDEIDTVSVYGPFESRDTMNRISGSLDETMLSYFKRRFRKIQTLGNEGHMAVWSR